MKLRAFNGYGMCHEITLSNGKVILLDPYFVKTRAEAFRETVERVDYILITHTHWDHDADVPYFWEKFQPKIIVGALSAMSFMKFHRIPYRRIFPVQPGESYRFSDFKLEIHRAKHNFSDAVYSPEADIGARIFTGHQECDTWGSLESLDFNITTNENFRIAVASGESVWDTQQRAAETFAPNLVLRQAGRRKDGKQIEPEELAQLFCSYGAALVVPGHYDIMRGAWGEERVKAYFDTVREEMRKKSPETDLLFPEMGRYYRIGVTAQAE